MPPLIGGFLFMNVNLGKRLKAISQEVVGDILLDIGSDHGKLPLYLLLNNSISKAVITDLNEMPLHKAKESMIAANCDDRCSFILADGLQIDANYIKMSDTVVIAGMGGELIADILNRSNKSLLRNKKIVLQPMSREEILRRSLCLSGFEIKKEYIVAEHKKYFDIIVCEYSGNPHNISTETEAVGFLSADDKTNRDYLTARYKKYKNIYFRSGKDENGVIKKYIDAICKRLGEDNENQ